MAWSLPSQAERNETRGICPYVQFARKIKGMEKREAMRKSWGFVTFIVPSHSDGGTLKMPVPDVAFPLRVSITSFLRLSFIPNFLFYTCIPL